MDPINNAHYRARYDILHCLTKSGASSIPPTPTLLPWGTELEVVEYYSANVTAVKRRIDFEDEECSTAISNLEVLVENESLELSM